MGQYIKLMVINQYEMAFFAQSLVGEPQMINQSCFKASYTDSVD